MIHFMSGAIVVAGLLSSLYFLRAWGKTRDRFFLFFATAFGLLALERILLESLSLPDETHHTIFLTRLLAFALILIGIADKNRRHRSV